MAANLPVVTANINQVFELAELIAKYTPFDGQPLSKARLCRKKIIMAYIKTSHSANCLKIINASLNFVALRTKGRNHNRPASLILA